ncbi:hypothetical protein EYZ11_005801 [Aspergillus tanneri]|uniref:Thioesterase domain-containing protein n=1 Tax=Aspergillus tanneri TaxID=1220188 RepID=A0A4S3JN09_9EURO|nr:hypothetical protein EYZ11_005801 [Aspergillus tanneri]
MEQNPYQIQPGPKTRDTATPMVLFHDAGGTIFPYFRLADLHRPVYGISNARFNEGGHWQHGFRQMGVVYTHLVRSVIPSGNIFLGGWSLGGSLALEVAARLMKLPQYKVQGVILIDSIFLTESVKAHCPTTLDEFVASFKFPSQISDTHLAQAKQCVLHCYQAQCGWQPPPLSSRPPAVLLRATDPVNPEVEEMHFLDGVRSSTYLGWEDCDASFIVASLEVAGSHFTLFDSPHVWFSHPAPKLSVAN